MIEGGYEDTARLTAREGKSVERAAMAICNRYGITAENWQDGDRELVDAIYRCLYHRAGTAVIEAMQSIVKGLEDSSEPGESLDYRLIKKLQRREMCQDGDDGEAVKEDGRNSGEKCSCGYRQAG